MRVEEEEDGDELLDEEIFADDLTGIGLSVEFWMLITRKKGDEIASGKVIGPEESEAAF